MKTLFLLPMVFLVGCASTAQTQYYEASKSLSKDSTVASSACFAAVSEIAKGGDNAAKTAAIALAERCKAESFKLQAPTRNWLGF